MKTLYTKSLLILFIGIIIFTAVSCKRTQPCAGMMKLLPGVRQGWM
ncbi:hypothetical protein KRR40_14920 [Niabella defluvii]|nr:hypothetical protein KRR40_14920 [Niabella sp. I65]